MTTENKKERKKENMFVWSHTILSNLRALESTSVLILMGRIKR